MNFNYFDWFVKNILDDGATLKGIDDAFKNNKPAIVGSHRINFIGSLNEQNRTNNLGMLKNILNKIILKYPNVEFISSAELADIIVAK